MKGPSIPQSARALRAPCSTEAEDSSTRQSLALSAGERLRAHARTCLRVAMLLGLAFLALRPATAQEPHRRKVPGLDKATSGFSHLAFSGKVESVDLKRKVLNVNTVQGGSTEIFPLKKGIHVSTADGEKLKLGELTPGTNVIIYYEQKGDRRQVREIVVLASGAAETKKAPPHS